MQDMPQIQQGDIVRVETKNRQSTTCQFVRSDQKWDEWLDCVPKVNINDVVAVYRFDGRDFKCIWEDGDYTMHELYKSLAKVDETMDEYKKAMEELNEYIAKLMKKERDAK